MFDGADDSDCRVSAPASHLPHLVCYDRVMTHIHQPVKRIFSSQYFVLLSSFFLLFGSAIILLLAMYSRPNLQPLKNSTPAVHFFSATFVRPLAQAYHLAATDSENEQTNHQSPTTEDKELGRAITAFFGGTLLIMLISAITMVLIIILIPVTIFFVWHKIGRVILDRISQLPQPPYYSQPPVAPPVQPQPPQPQQPQASTSTTPAEPSTSPSPKQK